MVEEGKLASEAKVTRVSTGSATLPRILLLVCVFAFTLAPILATPVVPMVDFYNHFARYYILSHLGSDHFLTTNYIENWRILPNIGMDVIGCVTAGLVPPLIAAKILIILTFAIQYTGILYFNRQLTGKWSITVALLTAPLLFSFIFTWGFANFLLGLGLVFWAAGWWLAVRHRPALAIPTASLFAALIFLTHGVAFALYGLLLGGLELGLFFTATQRRLPDLIRQMLALAVQAVAPAVLFAASPTSKSPKGVTNADEAIRNLAEKGALADRIRELVEYRLMTIVRVSDGPSLGFDLIVSGLTAGVIVLLLTRGRLALPKVTWPALAIATVLVAATPPTLFGVGYVADRMPLFLALLAVGSLCTIERPAARLDAVCRTVLAGLLAARVTALMIAWEPYRGDLEAFRAISTRIEPHSLVVFVNLANDRRLDPGRRCEMFGPLLVPLGGHASPIFAYNSQQPIALAGPLKAAVDALPPPSGMKSGLLRASRRFAAIAEEGRFDYALVCEPERIGSGLPATVERVAEQGRFALFKLSGNHAD